MTPTNNINEVIMANSGKTFTHEEAVDFMRYLDKYPTSNNNIEWVDVKTHRKVVFSY